MVVIVTAMSGRNIGSEGSCIQYIPGISPPGKNNFISAVDVEYVKR